MTYGKETRVDEGLSLDQAERWVKPRLSARRFAHTQGVVAMARQLAERFDCDQYLAQLAAWLHDASKETKDSELVKLAKSYGLCLTDLEEKNGHLLHGPVAAQLVKTELAVGNREVLDAIAQHTLGAKAMSSLAKIVFLADAIEPGRPKDYTDPIWNALAGSQKHEVLLDQAVLVTLESNLADLLAGRRVIHPLTVEVRNYYLSCLKAEVTS